MKIDKSLQPVSTVSVSDGKRRTDLTPNTNTEQENNVHLSSNVAKLQNIDSNSASGSIVNTARVQTQSYLNFVFDVRTSLPIPILSKKIMCI